MKRHLIATHPHNKCIRIYFRADGTYYITNPFKNHLSVKCASKDEAFEMMNKIADWCEAYDTERETAADIKYRSFKSFLLSHKPKMTKSEAWLSSQNFTIWDTRRTTHNNVQCVTYSVVETVPVSPGLRKEKMASGEIIGRWETHINVDRGTYHFPHATYDTPDNIFNRCVTNFKCQLSKQKRGF